MQLSTLLLAGLAATTARAATTATVGIEQPSSAPIYMQPTVQGCFKSSGDLVKNQTYTWNSLSQCAQTICQEAKGKNVAATTAGSLCYCGDSYPPEDSLVDDSFCNTPCTGYPQEACGGAGYFTVYNTGLLLAGVPYADSDSSSSSSATASSSTASSSAKSSPTTTSASSASTTVVGGHTIFVTQTSSSSASADPDPDTKKSSSKNTVGIAVGSVVGVVAVAGIAGGVFVFMRRRRNKEIEEEYRRNAAVNAFFGSGKSDAAASGPDARLDPVIAQRRLSDGSIADNEDYSRRILRVTNA